MQLHRHAVTRTQTCSSTAPWLASRGSSDHQLLPLCMTLCLCAERFKPVKPGHWRHHPALAFPFPSPSLLLLLLLFFHITKDNWDKICLPDTKVVWKDEPLLCFSLWSLCLSLQISLSFCLSCFPLACPAFSNMHRSNWWWIFTEAQQEMDIFMPRGSQKCRAEIERQLYQRKNNCFKFYNPKNEGSWGSFLIKLIWLFKLHYF